MAAAERKWKDFKNTRDQPAHIELTADDLNNLIAENRHARGKAFVAIEGNRLRIQTSVPLNEFVGHGRLPATDYRQDTAVATAVAGSR